MQDINSLSHTKWNCKYHIVFASKYRRKVFYEEKRIEIGTILRELCKRKEVSKCISMSRPYTYAVRNTIQNKFIKLYEIFERKEKLIIYDRLRNMKFKYRNRKFWCRGCYVDTVGKNKQKISIKHTEFMIY